jgi:phage shock protein A
MPIFRRIADMLSANLNDLIERIEDPEALLRQAVREMESAVEQTMNAAARSIASERLLSRQIDEHRRQSAALIERAREAVLRQDDARARILLADRRRHDDLAAALEDQLKLTRSQNARLRRQLDALRLRLAEARQTMDLHIARNRAATAQRRFATDTFRLNVSSDAFQRFDRLRERIDRTEAESQAWLELVGEYETGDEVAVGAIDIELAALKAELAASP